MPRFYPSTTEKNLANELGCFLKTHSQNTFLACREEIPLKKNPPGSNTPEKLPASKKSIRRKKPLEKISRNLATCCKNLNNRFISYSCSFFKMDIIMRKFHHLPLTIWW